jgi:hypothetical protein
MFIKHPLENSMASLSFTSNVLDEGTTFIFGSWICVANGLGGFISHLVDSRKPETSPATRCSNLDSFINDLDKLLLPDLPRQIERTSIFYVTSICAAPGLLGSDSNRSEEAWDPSPSPTWRRTWITSSRFETREPLRIGGSPFSTTTQIPMKSWPPRWCSPLASGSASPTRWWLQLPPR